MIDLKLTIAVPTYNRKANVSSLVGALLDQITKSEEILVLDNCSSFDVKNVLLELYGSHPMFEQVRVCRNIQNIGANANILRCFEMAAGDWIWIMGDDDLPKKGSLSLIKNDVFANDDVCWISYESGKSMKCFRIGLVVDNMNFDRALFISSNVYRVDKIIRYLRIGYDFAYACAPHLSMALCAANEIPVLFSEKTIVNQGTQVDGMNWNFLKVGARIFSLIENPALDEYSRHVLTKKINQEWGCGYRKFFGWFYMLSHQEKGLNDIYFSIICNAHVNYRSQWFFYCYTQLLVCLLKLRWFARRFSSLVYKLLSKQKNKGKLTFGDESRL